MNTIVERIHPLPLPKELYERLSIEEKTEYLFLYLSLTETDAITPQIKRKD